MNIIADMDLAVAALRAGELVVFPTDTVWGLGLAASYAPGPEAIFAAKGRPSHKPVAWLVAGPDALNVYGNKVPDYARNLAHAFWPGALTLVVPASSEVADPYVSRAGSIGLRMPAHATALELVRQVGPVAASSANLSGESDPSSRETIADALVDSAACVLDLGAAPSGVASTVVDCTGRSLRILRQGAILL